MKCKCENRVKIDHSEESKQVNGVFQTIRVRRTQCLDCGQIWNKGSDLMALREGTAIDDYWGVTYDSLEPSRGSQCFDGPTKTADERILDKIIAPNNHKGYDV